MSSTEVAWAEGKLIWVKGEAACMAKSSGPGNRGFSFTSEAQCDNFENIKRNSSICL